MTPAQVHKRLIRFSRVRRQKLTLAGERDMMPTIVLGEGDHFLEATAVVFDRDVCLAMLHFASQIAQPDVIALVTEGYGHISTKPDDELPLIEDLKSTPPGHFKAQFEAGTPDHYEVLMVTTMGADGYLGQHVAPFSQEDGRLKWIGDEMEYEMAAGEEVTLVGAVPDAMNAILSSPRMDGLDVALDELASNMEGKITRENVMEIASLALDRMFDAGTRTGDIATVLPIDLYVG